MKRGRPLSTNGEIVLEYLKRFPNLPNLTLSKKIYLENKELFSSVDYVRTHIRYYKGKQGASQKNKLANKTFVNIKNKPHLIPESHTKHVEVWKLPKTNKKILILSDIHIPYHDVEAIKTALNEGKQQGIDTIYLNGDIMDFFMLSFHEKNPKNRPSLKNELDMAREFFAYLRQEFPNVTIYFKPGNHEYRLERYLYLKAPELLDCEEFQLKVLLELAKHKIIFIEKRTKTYFGDLLIEHGDRMKGNGGVNPARSLYMRYKRHILTGHFHRKSEHVEKIYDGSLVTTFSVACLCELEPEFFEVNNHAHGFAIVEMSGDNFKVRNYLIEDGKLY
jgi:predicted phosphodiesterase